MTIKGLTINEGFNNLGTYLLDIQSISNSNEPVLQQNTDEPNPTILKNLLFKLIYETSQKPIPTDFKCEFTVKGRLTDEDIIYNLYVNADGFVELDTAFQPIVKRLPDENTIIRYLVTGPLDQRNEEMYVLVDTPGGLRYTLITDFTIGNSHELKVLTGTGTSYAVSPDITFTANTVAVYITKEGEIFGFESNTNEWVSYDKIRFSTIQFPAKLTTAEDGFYATNADTGTVTNGFLGTASTVFEDFSGKVTNPELFKIDVVLNVFDPSDPTAIYTETFTNLLPGTLNFIPVSLPGSAPARPDNSTTISQIETISGTTFSASFRTFLTDNSLTTVDKIRKAGPIAYINNFPSEEVGAEELQLLQGHVDFYSLNPDSEKNQVIIDANYKTVASIVDAPANKFASDIEGTSFTLFEASKIHRIATENKKLVNNLLAGVLTDLTLAEPSIPNVANSNFSSVALSSMVNSCGCDDCKSNISPFSYLMDLLNYGAAHIKHIVTPVYNPTDKQSFITLLQNKFLQPFGTLNVDCKTLKEEFCRVRLVTEVFEELVSIKTTAGQISPAKLAALAATRNKYLQLVYQALLQQLGTNIQEVRSVYIINDAAKKKEAALKLANKLGFTLYDGVSNVYTTDLLFLTLTNPPSPANTLTASNIEVVFGFRDTQRDVLTYPPTSKVALWQDAERQQNWTNEDFVLSPYTREGANPSNLSTIKPYWLPIIDPDNMGPQSFTYNSFDAHEKIWLNRKTDTDTFIDHYIFGNAFNTLISADIDRRILKVATKDISTQVFEDNNIILYDTSLFTPVWVTFKVNAKSLNAINTDIILEKSTQSLPQPALFQPGLISGYTNPVMRYMRQLSVSAASITPISSSPYKYEITWQNPVIEDYYTAVGYVVKLISDDGTNPPIVYDNDGSPNDLAVTYITDKKIEIESTVQLSSAFLNGTITFYYDVVVELVNDKVLDVVKLLNDAATSVFDNTYTYDYTGSTQVSGSNSINYLVWSNSSAAWGSLTGATNFAKLLNLQLRIANKTATDLQLDIVTNKNYLANTISNFNSIINLLKKCNDYQKSMYTFPKPTIEEVYDIGSILRVSAKNKLINAWVSEEIVYPEPSSTALVIQAKGAHFWQPLVKPIAGVWDSRLQTIPATVPAINSKSIAIIDPDNADLASYLNTPEAQPYRNLYLLRKAELKTEYDTILATLTGNIEDGFTEVLNYINTGSTSTPFNIAPYADLEELNEDLNNVNPFLQHKAEGVITDAFRLTTANFNYIYNLKLNAESGDPLLYPTNTEYTKSAKICLQSYKLLQLYLATSNPWIEEEISGSINLPSTNTPVKYYNVFNLSLDAYRANEINSNTWEKTLNDWNGQPFIQPDFVPPQNIKNFVPTSITYTLWNNRNTQILADQTTLNTQFNSTVIVLSLITNFEKCVSFCIARAGTFTGSLLPGIFTYFTNIKVAEQNGENIRPIVTQLGFTLESYRYLRTIYDTLLNETGASPSQLIADEYKNIVDIFIRAKYANTTFDWVKEEFTNNLPLTQKDFKLIDIQPTDFPITNLPVFNQWRAPYANRKAWKDKLETRIDQEKNANQKIKDALQEVEDINMPVMRDALIIALATPCESLADAAERLAKTYFIETKDNCCYKHTRVSFALETLQGFYLALQTGIFDDFVQNFKLIAPDFEQEWKWLGSYATWRGAMFTFIYPENLLYPTLKRQQSPAFVKLATTLREANRFSPLDACDAAKEYEEYLRDIETLSIICSSNVKKFYTSGNDTCCDSSQQLVEETFFFAQSQNGNPYFTSKISNEKDGLKFWKKLEISGQDLKLLGAFVRSKRNSSVWWQLDELYVDLYYTYTDKTTLKMAYISKDVLIDDKPWSEPVEMDDLPQLDDIQPAFVTACQSSYDWEHPYFVFSYGKSVTIYETIRIKQRWNSFMIPRKKDWMFPAAPPNATNFSSLSFQVPVAQYNNVHLGYKYSVADNKFNSIISTVYNNEAKPLCALTFKVTYVTNDYLFDIALAFEDTVYVGAFGKAETYKWLPPFANTTNYRIAGVYELAPNTNTMVVHIRSKQNPNPSLLPLSSPCVFEVKVIPDLSNVTTPIVNPFNQTLVYYSSGLKLQNVLPNFKLDSALRLFALSFKTYNNSGYSGFIIKTGAYSWSDLCNLKFKPSSISSISSFDCIEDIKARTLNVKNNIIMNLSPPMGINTFATVPEIIKHMLYEAYYFVPMLLALDQQKRGSFEVALDWYRSIYDYSQDDNLNRKIFYGLVLEESITNSYTQTPNWLLDPLNPHLIAQTRTNAYTKYTLMNIVQCLYAYADREFTLDTIESVPRARRLYTTALELLKTKALNLKANDCEVKANNCLQITNPELAPGSPLNQTLRMLQINLQKIGKVSVIETVGLEIETLLNSATAETIGEAIAESEELIRDNMPAPATVLNITEVVAKENENYNAAFSYVLAINKDENFVATVAEAYSARVANIVGLAPEQLNLPEFLSKTAWLADEVPYNSTAFTFEFANASGIQNLSGNLAYNPVGGTKSQLAFNANMLYANATTLIHTNTYNLPSGYTALTSYLYNNFCMPKNPIYKGLGLKGNVELYKIFNCRNIAGMVRELDVFAAATDSTTGVPIIGAAGNLTIPGVGNFAPSQYRFRVLLERAKVIAAQAQQLESLFLAALEKEDAETYSQLRAKQDLTTAKATVKLQDLRIKQAQNEKGLAEIQLDKVNFSLNYYENLVSSGLNAYEITSLIMLESTVTLQGVLVGLYTSKSIADGASAAALAVSGVGAPLAPILFSNAASSAFSAISAASNGLSTQASILSQLASFQRRQEEWNYQKNLAGFDISLANQQIKIAEDGVRIAGQEREISELNATHAADSLEFLKNKFTNAELYNWMGNVLERSYSYMLNLSTAIARTAEQQLYFERQEQAGPFILDDYWEMPSSGYTAGASGNQNRRGLTGSARLLVDITRLDQYAFESNKRKLQMTKVISLAQNFPSEFQEFKETGVLNFDLTNRQFDYDFPGHYLRLINSVKTTVIGLLPVYDQIKATLTSEATSYTVLGGNTFQRAAIRRAEIDTVALTAANNATGLFELTPMGQQSEFLNPFEGMGIESRWEFKMSKFSNRVDYNNIADVLLTVEYTALDSFQYRYQVLQELQNEISFNRGFSYKNNFPDQWYELAQVEQGTGNFGVTVDLKREFFPQGIDELQLDGNIVLYFVRSNQFTNEIDVAKFGLDSGSSVVEDIETIDGKITANITNGTENSPVMKLRLEFANTPENRELFSEENVTDILLLIPCKGTLMNYTL